MKIKMHRLVSILVFIFTEGTISAQVFDLKQWRVLPVAEIEKLAENINAQTTSPCTVIKYTMLSFQDQMSTIPADAELGETRIFNGSSWGKFMNSESYRDGKLSIVVNHTEKKVVISESGVLPEKDPVSKWSDVLYTNSEVYSRHTKEGKNILVKYHSHPDVLVTELIVDKEDRIKKSIVFLNRRIEVETESGIKNYQPRLEVIFDRIEEDSQCNQSKYSLRSIINFTESGEVVLNENLNNYTVVDTRPRAINK